MCMREMRTELNELRHAFGNIGYELEILQSKAATHEELIASLQDRRESDYESKGCAQFELAQIKRDIDELDADYREIQKILRDLKGSTSEHDASLAYQKKRLQEMENSLDCMHGALGGLTDIVQTPKKATSSGSVYKVESGDTLEKIARRHGTSVDSIKTQNQLTSDMIRVGQKLSIR
ncbi:MAG: LysM peptidoglycan-binding domain-containing protein [Chlamydiia bacterium]|nr:LysM peptidoglycan-binding domain-containing protein [Chlamydiia bacterium]